MACPQHPKFNGIRLGKNAKDCPDCVAFNTEVKAALPGGKEKRNRKAKKVEVVDPAPLGEVFSDPVQEDGTFKPVDEDGVDKVQE
jgi:hypothetical protein